MAEHGFHAPEPYLPPFLRAWPAWLRRALLWTAAAAFWLLLWFLAARRLGQPLLLPAPGAVLARLAALTATADFWLTVGTSLLRIVAGILIGVAAGTLLAFLTHFIRPLYALCYPLITVIRATPVASFIILIYLWMSRDTLPAFISVLIVLPVVWSNLHEALGATDPALLEMARVFRFSPWRTLRRVYIPALRPSLGASVRSAIGLAWKAGIAAEVLTVPAVSVGRHLSDAKLYLETTDLFAWTLTVILLSLALEVCMLALLRLSGRKGARQSAAPQSAGKRLSSATDEPTRPAGKEAQP